MPRFHMPRGRRPSLPRARIVPTPEPTVDVAALAGIAAWMAEDADLVLHPECDRCDFLPVEGELFELVVPCAEHAEAIAYADKEARR